MSDATEPAKVDRWGEDCRHWCARCGADVRALLGTDEIELAPEIGPPGYNEFRHLTCPPVRVGPVNCQTDDPKWNTSHLIVANLIEGGLAACGVVLSPADHPSKHVEKHGACACAPAEEWSRCDGCVRAREEAAARKAARDEVRA